MSEPARPSLIRPATPINRRSALIGTAGLLAQPALVELLHAKPLPPAPTVWPQALQVPGGVARLSLGPAATRPVAQVRQGDVDVPLRVVGDAIEWTAIVGIPLAAAPGDAFITVLAEGGGSPRLVHYAVAPKQYKEQHLKVSPRTVDLSPEDQARYERERDHQAQVMATFTEQPAGVALPSLRMRVPVPGRRSSSFGLRRVFNGQPRNPHSGMDIAAATGTPIVAAAGGVVVFAGWHAAYGHMVEVDHGNDLVTRYAHASQLHAKQGDLVRRGQKIANVGNTGRSTGAHLHFEVLVAGVPQDPQKFLDAGKLAAQPQEARAGPATRVASGPRR